MTLVGGIVRRLLGVRPRPPAARAPIAPPISPWPDSESARRERHRAALMVLDDNTVACVVIAVVNSPSPEVKLAGDVPWPFWAALADTMQELVNEARG